MHSDPTKSLTSTSEVGKDLGLTFLKLLMSEVSRIGYSPALTLNITDTKGIWSSGTFEELEENARSLLGLPRAADFEDHGLTLLDLSVEYTAKPVVEGEEEDLLESLLATMQLEGEERPAPLPEDSFFNLEDAGSLVEDLCSLHPHAEEGSPLRVFVEGLVPAYLASFDRMKDWLHPREAQHPWEIYHGRPSPDELGDREVQQDPYPADEEGFHGRADQWTFRGQACAHRGGLTREAPLDHRDISP